MRGHGVVHLPAWIKAGWVYSLRCFAASLLRAWPIARSVWMASLSQSLTRPGLHRTRCKRCLSVSRLQLVSAAACAVACPAGGVRRGMRWHPCSDSSTYCSGRCMHACAAGLPQLHVQRYQVRSARLERLGIYRQTQHSQQPPSSYFWQPKTADELSNLVTAYCSSLSLCVGVNNMEMGIASQELGALHFDDDEASQRATPNDEAVSVKRRWTHPVICDFLREVLVPYLWDADDGAPQVSRQQAEDSQALRESPLAVGRMCRAGSAKWIRVSPLPLMREVLLPACLLQAAAVAQVCRAWLLASREACIRELSAKLWSASDFASLERFLRSHGRVRGVDIGTVQSELSRSAHHGAALDLMAAVYSRCAASVKRAGRQAGGHHLS